MNKKMVLFGFYIIMILIGFWMFFNLNIPGLGDCPNSAIGRWWGDVTPYGCGRLSFPIMFPGMLALVIYFLLLRKGDQSNMVSDSGGKSLNNK